jgi:L,D-peptidoglycan transpeptidase YkuD (ErfK/YbiS/YcfS/YnhG family)
MMKKHLLPLFIFSILVAMSCNPDPAPTPLDGTTPSVSPKENALEDHGKFGLETDFSPEENPMEGTQQLILVIMPDDKTVSGKMYRFNRGENTWATEGEPYPVSIGKNGLAWGKGLLDDRFKRGYYKQEGDGKAPAGIFPLAKAFGYADPKKAEFIKLPYMQSTKAHRCVDDAKSEFYNEIVDTKEQPETWDSAEKMVRKDDLYKWGIDVTHTRGKSEGDGSCIFIHIWRGEGKPTAGCTASTEKNIVELLTWIDPSKQPRLVQITEADYSMLKQWFDLPELD